jgi:stearoyl-CoA desaturase (delta-9 desaturase)
MAHGGIKLHPLVSGPFRFWLWLTSAVNTREWIAVHRKHHSYTDRKGDPHSPKIFGKLSIVLKGWYFYYLASKDAHLIEQYGNGAPQDWIERNIFTPYPSAGLFLMGALNLAVFGIKLGLVLSVLQLAWTPFIGDVINGFGHFLGYRNTEVKDTSTNIFPIGFIFMGEELHNNHHADPKSPQFSMKFFELDMGWIYIQILSLLRLATILYQKRIPIKIRLAPEVAV